MGIVVVKCAPWKEVVDYAEIMLTTSSMASSAYTRSSIMANNPRWSMEPNTI